MPKGFIHASSILLSSFASHAKEDEEEQRGYRHAPLHYFHESGRRLVQIQRESSQVCDSIPISVEIIPRYPWLNWHFCNVVDIGHKTHKEDFGGSQGHKSNIAVHVEPSAL